MTITLSKGGNLDLTKDAPELAAVTVGLGWDARTTTGEQFDLDASAIVCDELGQALSDDWLVFFNNLRSPDSSVVHLGDNLTGAGEGDDEQITVNLDALSERAARIVFAVEIFDAVKRNQSFGQVRNAYVRVFDQADTTEAMVRYDLSEEYSTETAVVVGEMYRRGSAWKFKAVGQGYPDGLAGVAKDYGLNVVGGVL